MILFTDHCSVLEVQIALKIKENDVRREQKVCFFSGAPNGAKKELKH